MAKKDFNAPKHEKYSSAAFKSSEQPDSMVELGDKNSIQACTGS